MKFRMISNPRVKTTAMRVPTEGEPSSELVEFVGPHAIWGLKASGDCDGCDIRISQDRTMWITVEPGDWIKRDSNDFIGKQDHESFISEWEPDDEH